MFSMFDELKMTMAILKYELLELKKKKRLNRFQKPNNEKSFKKTFGESSKSRGVFRTHASIYDGAFL